jgi:hypothetical protein
VAAGDGRGGDRAVGRRADLAVAVRGGRRGRGHRRSARRCPRRRCCRPCRARTRAGGRHPHGRPVAGAPLLPRPAHDVRDERHGHRQRAGGRARDAVGRRDRERHERQELRERSGPPAPGVRGDRPDGRPRPLLELEGRRGARCGGLPALLRPAARVGACGQRHRRRRLLRGSPRRRHRARRAARRRDPHPQPAGCAPVAARAQPALGLSGARATPGRRRGRARRLELRSRPRGRADGRLAGGAPHRAVARRASVGDRPRPAPARGGAPRAGLDEGAHTARLAARVGPRAGAGGDRVVARRDQIERFSTLTAR